MDKVLLDTSTYIDAQRAPKNRRPDWARNTLGHLTAYRAHHAQLTVSSFTIFEVLDGIYRRSGAAAARAFSTQVLPLYEVIYPDHEINAAAAEINAALADRRQTIGTGDTFIAATAIMRKMELVTSNTRHFKRVEAAGFPIRLQDWRAA